ncbi:FHA domain-containing protein [Defluviimonas sp. SAOS-178_SWC]|uniref:FHA domain-containing protein n=1 Tax=Defluviimonas sp. SAOS-178_SWC TaxID=3121287 RepID=UPI00322220C6
MRSLRDVIVRKRPLPPSEKTRDTGDAEQVSDFFDLVAMREKLQEPDGAGEQTTGSRADPPQEEASVEAEAPASPATKKQIWDIEPDERDEDTARLAQRPQRRAPEGRHADEMLPARALTGLERDGGKGPALTGAARVKTRIIGFHAGGAENDVFAADRATPSARGQYPVGWLVVVDGPGRGASFTIGTGVSTIGRGADQTVCLDFGDTSVSRENHALVAYDDEQNKFFVGHGGKSNIVRRNGNPVLATEDLADADLIRIGKTTLRFVALCGPDFTWGPTEDRQETDARED